MAIPVLPLTLVSSLERRLVTSVAEARSPFTGTSQIQDWGACWWEYQIEMAVTQSAILPLVPYLDTLRWVFIAVALGGIAVTIYARLDDWKRGQR